MKPIIFLVLILTVCISAIDPLKDLCKYNVKESALYDLFGFSHLSNKEVTVSLKEDEEYPASTMPTMTFHLCNRQVASCDAGTSTKNADLNFGTVSFYNSSAKATQCKDLTATNVNATANFLNSSNYSQGILLTYPKTDNGFTLIVKLTCDKAIPEKDIVWKARFNESLSSQTHTVILEGSGAPGCPLITLEQFLQVFEKYKPLFAIVFLLVGLLALTMGFQFFNVTIFVLTTTVVTMIGFAFISYATTSDTTPTFKWIAFGISFAFGLAIGYCAVKIQKLGFFTLGTLLGGVGAFFLYTFLLHFFNLSHATLMLFIVILSVLGGALAIWLWKDVIILATSCIGSYFTVRAISFYLSILFQCHTSYLPLTIEGFPNELKISEGLSSFDYRAYTYLVAIVIIAVLGMIHQVRKKKAHDDEVDSYKMDMSVSQI